MRRVSPRDGTMSSREHTDLAYAKVEARGMRTHEILIRPADVQVVRPGQPPADTAQTGPCVL